MLLLLMVGCKSKANYSSEGITDRAKRGFVLTLAFNIGSMYLSVCLDNHNHRSLSIVMTIGIAYVLGTKAKQRIFKDVVISLPFQNGVRFVSLFCSYG